MPGRNTRLSNKISPTESTNQLILTALILGYPINLVPAFSGGSLNTGIVRAGAVRKR